MLINNGFLNFMYKYVKIWYNRSYERGIGMIADTFFEKISDKYDALTNVYRRERIFEYVDYLISHQIPFTYCILDVDNFKQANDNYGHLFGDVVLKEIASGITEAILGRGIVGRFGGDEFIFILENIVEYQDVWQACYDVLKSPRPISFKDVNNYLTTYTIGAANFPNNAKTKEEVFELADKALYRGKQKGRNCFIIYVEEKHKDIFLKSERDKVYSQVLLHNKIYTDLNDTYDLEQSITNLFKFIGEYLIIDNLCIEYNEEIHNAYTHPLSKSKDIKPLGKEIVERYFSNSLCCVVDNNTSLQKANPSKMGSKFIENGIMATVSIALCAYGKHYGVLRADMVVLDTGRIWQQDDVCLLIKLAHTIALAKYIEEIKK